MGKLDICYVLLYLRVIEFIYQTLRGTTNLLFQFLVFDTRLYFNILHCDKQNAAFLRLFEIEVELGRTET